MGRDPSSLPGVNILDLARTPVGRARKGSLVGVRPDDLAADVLRAVLDRNPGISGEEVDDVVCGVSSAGGEQGNNLGRVVSQLAGLPSTVPGTTCSRFCASSLQATRVAVHAIRSGESDLQAVVGVESVSRRMTTFLAAEHGNRRFLDHERPDYVNDLFIKVGETAERIADLYGVSRSDMDTFALRSHQRAVEAQRSGAFAREIVPVTTPEGVTISIDDGPRPSTSIEALAALRPAFREDGRVTAGNSSPLNDGAAAMLMASDGYVDSHDVTVRARVLGTSVTGLRPELMGLGPIEATRLLVKRLGISTDDFDAVELNEAFAAQVLPVCDELTLDIDRQVNAHGGAIALGHPYGMTGVRMLTSLINTLEERDGALGLATLCVGGGQGMAVVVERVAT